MGKFKFGLLENLKASVSFSGGRIDPITDHLQKVGSWLDENLHREGWLYPAEISQHRLRWDPEQRCDVMDDEPIPNTTRPIFLYSLPPTHTFEYEGELSDHPRRIIADILLQALGFFLGTRLQFSDWRIDLRIKVRNRQLPFSFWTAHHYTDDLSIMLEKTYKTVCGLDDKKRIVLLNLLTTHTRAVSYEWTWERFMWRYVALDACWALLVGGKGGHSKRIKKLCDKFGIPDSKADRDQIVSLRNNLAHEAIWDGAPYGTSGSAEANFLDLKLANLVDRLVMFVLDIPCGFRTTMWTSASQIGLDLEP